MSTAALAIRRPTLVLALVAGLLAAFALTPAAQPAGASAPPASSASAASAGVPSALASSASAARRGTSYTPKTGMKFNYPIGSEKQKRRLFRHIIRSVNNTPSGSTIRFAVFSFADKATADALLRAHARGVKVKLVFAGSNVYPPMKRLRAALGTNPDARSFVVLCDRSCRGESGQMHAKFFQFSRVGGASDVTMVGSNNLTRHNSHEQWSDLYTVADDRAYFTTFRRWFGQLVEDRPVARPYMRRTTGANTAVITPLDLARHRDPIADLLTRVVCLTPAGELDPSAPNPEKSIPTNLLISAHAWNGARGKRLARQIADLIRAGCKVRLFYGEGTGPAVRNIVSSPGGILRKGTHQGIRTHQKLMIVNGNVDGELDTVRVLTGSHNWSTRALPRDDLVVVTSDQEIGRGYVRAFWRMWNRG